jgi:hypothetical protein
MVIIKSTGKSGKIILNAIGNGFKDASIQINASE